MRRSVLLIWAISTLFQVECGVRPTVGAVLPLSDRGVEAVIITTLFCMMLYDVRDRGLLLLLVLLLLLFLGRF